MMKEEKIEKEREKGERNNNVFGGEIWREEEERSEKNGRKRQMRYWKPSWEKSV